jgi:hypothetical protein
MQAFTFLIVQTLERVFLPVNVGDRHSIGKAQGSNHKW